MLIWYKTKHGDIRLEEFRHAVVLNNTSGPSYNINGFAVEKAEYDEIVEFAWLQTDQGFKTESVVTEERNSDAGAVKEG